SSAGISTPFGLDWELPNNRLRRGKVVNTFRPLGASVAQLDRASDYGSEGSRFNSWRMRQQNQCFSFGRGKKHHMGRLKSSSGGNRCAGRPERRNQEQRSAPRPDDRRDAAIVAAAAEGKPERVCGGLRHARR